MPRRRVPKLCWHKGRSQFYVRLNGHQYYLGRDRNQAEVAYDQLVGEFFANGRRLPAMGGSQSGVTVAELIDQYRTHAEAYYVDGTGRPTGQVENEIKPACRVLRKRYGPTPAAEFGPLALQALRDQMIADQLSRGVINKRVGTIKRMFKWAASQQLIEAGVHLALTTVTGLRHGRGGKEREKVRAVSDRDVNAALKFLPKTVAAMVQMQRLTGMRPAEVCELRPGDLDRSDDIWILRPVKHKTAHLGRHRVIPLGPKAQEVLAPYLLRATDAYCFVPAESEERRRADQHAKRRTPAKYGNRPGTNRKAKPKRSPGMKYDVASYRRAIHRACDKADEAAKKQAERDDAIVDPSVRLVPRWSPNQLRHTAATMIRQKFGLEAAQTVLGHARADVTQIYAERDTAQAIAVMRQIG